MEKVIAGSPVEVNEEGYLLNPNDWTPELAKELASEYDINLTDKHFEVLNYLREQAAAGTALSIRRLGKSGIVTIKELYALFPGGPLKISSKLAGISKPASCV